MYAKLIVFLSVASLASAGNSVETSTNKASVNNMTTVASQASTGDSVETTTNKAPVINITTTVSAPLTSDVEDPIVAKTITAPAVSTYAPANTFPTSRYISAPVIAKTIKAPNSYAGAASKKVSPFITTYTDDPLFARIVKVPKSYSRPVATKKFSNPGLSYQSYSTYTAPVLSADSPFIDSNAAASESSESGYSGVPVETYYRPGHSSSMSVPYEPIATYSSQPVSYSAAPDVSYVSYVGPQFSYSW